MKTEYLTEPVGIDIPRPRLFWNCEQGQRQTAFQILAADDEGALLWDSGKVQSSAMRGDSPRVTKRRKKARKTSPYLSRGAALSLASRRPVSREP